PAPESRTAADEVLPQARLRLVHAERDRAADRGVLALHRQALLVEPVPGLVQDAEERRTEVVLVPAPGQAHVARAEPAAERVLRRVDPPAGKVEAEALRRLAREGELAFDREIAACRGGIGRAAGVGRGAYERHELVHELAEPARDVGRARAGFV